MQAATVSSGAIDVESPGPTELVVRWGTLPYNQLTPASTSIDAEIENTTPDARTATLVLISAGLDGRSVRRELRQITVPGGGRSDVVFAPKDFPIQSATSTPFVVAQVEYTSQGASRVVPSKPLYYRFDAGYGNVTLRPVEEVGITANDGEPTSPGAAPSGRIFSNGSFTDLIPDGIYGQTGFATLSADAADPLTASAPAAPQPSGLTSNISIKVCTSWHMQYIDSGLGEDIWTSTAWRDVPASYANATLLTSPGNVTVWAGQLDWQGCMPSSVSVASGTYKMQHKTTGIGTSPIFYNVYYMTGGTEFVSIPWATFTASSSTTYTVHPQLNNDAVQAAAVASTILVTHFLGVLGGTDLGIADGSYKVHANEGCPGDSFSGSCYRTDTDIVYIGTFQNNGYTEAHWKFIVAHEMGHQVQFHAMGRPNFNLDSDMPTQTACQCNFDAGYGTSHCLQSRELQGGAEVEGFGHGFASRIFNSASEANGAFNYYKPFRPDTGPRLFPPMYRDTYNAQRWMELHCTASDKGVEWDWSTFVFNVSNISTANQTKLSDLFNIYKAACGFANCDNNDLVGFPELDFMASSYYAGDARYTRFHNAGNSHGINH